MAEIFDWKAAPGSEGTIEFRVRETKFGDGYSQVVKDGINNKVQTWPRTFEGTLVEMQPIYDFFERHAGATSFLWTPPASTLQSLWRVKNFKMLSVGAGVYSVTAEFTQSFVP